MSAIFEDSLHSKAVGEEGRDSCSGTKDNPGLNGRVWTVEGRFWVKKQFGYAFATCI